MLYVFLLLSQLNDQTSTFLWISINTSNGGCSMYLLNV